MRLTEKLEALGVLIEGSQSMVPGGHPFSIENANIEYVRAHGWMDDKRGAALILDYIEDPDEGKWIKDQLGAYVREANDALKLLFRRDSKFFYNRNDLVARFCGWFSHALDNWPPKKRDSMIFYVAANQDSGDTIGIEVSRSGKTEVFEGNHEADPASYQLVDRLIGRKRPPMRFYANHTQDVVDKIESTKIVPKGLFLSPMKNVAAGYWGKDRVLFSIMLDPADLLPHSEQDWQTGKPARGTRFRYE